MVAEKLEFPISFKGLLSTLPFGREVITLKVCEPETVVKFGKVIVCEPPGVKFPVHG
jgi:hypothetical protein